MKRIVIFLFFVLGTFTSPALSVELGEDGLHKTSWLRMTFKDMTEDLAEANAERKRLAIIFEQRGCIYCTKMHNDVFPNAKIAPMLSEKFFFVQMNLFGDEEVTDFDGTVLSEKEMARRWGVVFTPTILFMPTNAGTNTNAAQAAVAMIPGAFGTETTFDMLNWVLIEGYNSDEHFQKYHARMFNTRKANGE